MEGKMIKILLDPSPDDLYRYRVELGGKVAGHVGHTYRMEQGWYFRNDDLGVYGTVRSRELAVRHLLTVPAVRSYLA